MKKNQKQYGFTLMEIVVATTIFATTLTIMMVLFNYTLKVNRRVDAQRQAAQGVRNFVETIVREIRNGKIDYTTTYTQCSPNYASSTNTALAIVTRSGELECFYVQNGNLYLEKASVVEQVNPKNLTVDTATFRFNVRPTANPHPTNPPYSGMQSFVTISGKFSVLLPGNTTAATIGYQTSVSPDVYDTPHKQ